MQPTFAHPQGFLSLLSLAIIWILNNFLSSIISASLSSIVFTQTLSRIKLIEKFKKL